MTTVISNLILIKKEDRRRIDGKIDNNFSNGRYFSNDRYFNRDMEIAISRNCCNSNGSFDLVEIVIFFFFSSFLEQISDSIFIFIYEYIISEWWNWGWGGATFQVFFLIKLNKNNCAVETMQRAESYLFKYVKF